VKFSSALHSLVFAIVYAIAWQPRAEAQALPECLAPTCAVQPCGAPLNVVRVASPTVLSSQVLSARANDFAEPLLAITAQLGGLTLSEKQEDQIFTIIHDASPSVRQNAKQFTKTYASLRKLGFSSEYNKTAMEALVRAVGDAAAQSAELHARLEHEIAGVLTPEQRRALEESGRSADRGICSLNCSTTGPVER
jgi:LTXXQ motif family protein